jgi:transcriptional regulator with XRE-family HTH domain
MTDPESTEKATEVLDPGIVRAGAAAAARRRELDISQRSLAADGVINAGALIAFEKGRSWPRERTRAKLEEMLHWPPGTIARLRQGEPASVEYRAEPTAEPGDDVSLIAQAVGTVVSTFGTVVEALPSVDDPAFTPRATKILADLRQLEAVAARAARISKVSPPLIKTLSAVRTRYDELMLRAARAPRATVGQRLYAARRGANLTILETAQAAGVSEEDIVRAEAEEPVSAAAVREIESLIEQLN